MFNVSPELEALVKFILETKWEDLPDDIVHETKNIILDSIGNAIGGITTDPGKMIVALAKKLGGPPESSILGAGGKVSCSNAVLANGQLINTLDFDAMPGGHTPPYIIPPPLAMAEVTKSSGKDLILATALGFEIATRVAGAVSPRHSGIGSANFKWAPRSGYADYNIGAAAGAGKILNLDYDKMTHALGIAGHLCQILPWVRYSFSEQRHMTKYGMPGWQNTGAVQAVLLAEMGYQGDTTLFDAEHGFWRFAGYEGWAPERITDGLGKTWSFTGGRYKRYACCSVLHNALDCFLDIITQNNLKPEDIESVRTYLPQTVEAPCFTSRELNNIVDIQFGIHNVFALAVHGIRTGPEWQDLETVREPRFVEFANKVSLQVHPEVKEKPSASKVEVVTKGKTFVEERERAISGSGGVLHMTDEELLEKFRHNTSRILTENKIEEAISALQKLETLTNIIDLMKQVTI